MAAPKLDPLIQSLVFSIRHATINGPKDKEKPLDSFKPDDYLEVTRMTATDPSGLAINVKEYAPQVFRSLRQSLKISNEDFVKSWDLSEENMQAKEGAGRSGALFGKSEDKRYIFKTIFHTEVVTLLAFLQSYHAHMLSSPDTLLMKILGLYRVQQSVLKSVYLLIFENALHAPVAIRYVYDLKGRKPKPGKFGRQEPAPGVVLKDNDLTRVFYLGDNRRPFFAQLEKDVTLLQNNNLMDYSLLVGVYRGHKSKRHGGGKRKKTTRKASKDEAHDHAAPAGLRRKHGNGIVAHPDAREVYYIGVIDMLTFYGAAKRIANAAKSLLWEQAELSTVEAQYYATRFLSAMKDIFPDSPPPPDFLDNTFNLKHAPQAPQQVPALVTPPPPEAAVPASAPPAGAPQLSASPTLEVVDPAKTQALLSPRTQTKNESNEFLRQVVQGIQKSAQNTAERTIREANQAGSGQSATALTLHAFCNHAYHEMRSAQTSAPFSVKEYSPLAFQYLRTLYGVFTEDFVSSWIMSSNFEAKEGAGRSGALFMFSEDRRFILKTIFHNEVFTLLNMLHDYVEHFRAFPETLLMQICGLYRFSSGLVSSEYVLVFRNLMHSPLKPDSVYDLKGRRPKPGKFLRNEGKTGIVFKDNDLNRKFKLGPLLPEFMEQLTLDVKFLQNHNVMDYSLLIGVRALKPDDKAAVAEYDKSMEEKLEKNVQNCLLYRLYKSRMDMLQGAPAPLDGEAAPPPATKEMEELSLESAVARHHIPNKFKSFAGGFIGGTAEAPEVYFTGIIDMLTFYGPAKKTANAFKKMLWKEDELSTVESVFYGQRYLAYFKEILEQ